MSRLALSRRGHTDQPEAWEDQTAASRRPCLVLLMNRTDASILFPQKTGSLLPSSPQHPLSELWRSSWGWGVLAGPRPASLEQHCDQRDTLRMGPHRHTCGHLAFITAEDSSAGALLLCPVRPLLGMGVRRRLCGLFEAWMGWSDARHWRSLCVVFPGGPGTCLAPAWAPDTALPVTHPQG